MKAKLNRAIDALQATLPPNRVVVLLTPLIFAPVAGYVSTLIGKQVPGVGSDVTALTALFVAGATAAVVQAYKWLDGWQREEARRDAAGRGGANPEPIPRKEVT